MPLIDLEKIKVKLFSHYRKSQKRVCFLSPFVGMVRGGGYRTYMSDRLDSPRAKQPAARQGRRVEVRHYGVRAPGRV